MRKLLAILAPGGLGLLAAAPVIAVDRTELPHNGRVLIAVGGGMSLPEGEQADVVVVVGGHADIRGEVASLVVVDGTATLEGAVAEASW